MATTPAQADHGTRLLHAVERILAPTHELQSRVAGWREAVGNNVDAMADAAIRDFSNLSAIAGGATALPALMPGLGTVVSLATGPLADLVLSLKTEVELGLCLSAIHGFDITSPEERQLVFLASALHVNDARGFRPVVVDAMNVTASAVWTYTPRRVSKILVTGLAQMALAAMSRSFLRALPLVGIVVGAGMNKALTTRAGRKMHESLHLRRRLDSIPTPAA